MDGYRLAVLFEQGGKQRLRPPVPAIPWIDNELSNMRCVACHRKQITNGQTRVINRDEQSERPTDRW